MSSVATCEPFGPRRSFAMRQGSLSAPLLLVEAAQAHSREQARRTQLMQPADALVGLLDRNRELRHKLRAALGATGGAHNRPQIASRPMRKSICQFPIANSATVTNSPDREFGNPQATPNANTVRDRYFSPARSSVVGKPGRFGESGKCCVSRHSPLCAPYGRPDFPTSVPSR